MYKLCEGQRIYLRNIGLEDTGLMVKWKNDIVRKNVSWVKYKYKL